MMSEKFNVLVCDVPWKYDNVKTGGSLKSGASQHYETMNVVDIQNLYDWLHLDDIISKDSVLFFWTTNNMLDHAICTLELWGFTYKTIITLVKNNNGLGYWFRNKTEHILVGIKGKVKPFKCQLPNVITLVNTLDHSVKPYSSYQLIEEATKNMNPRYLELFARRQYKKWSCVGKDIDGLNIEESIERLKKNLLNK